MKFVIYLILFFSTAICKSQVKNMKPTYDKLTQKEINLINEQSEITPFRVLLTTSNSDEKILRTLSKDIDPNDPILKKLAERMYATVQDENSKGVGIAAPQIGINRNAIWVQRFDKIDQPFEFYINPKITWYSNILRNGREGCLSIPDQFGNVFRSLALQLNYFDIEGNQFEEIIEGFSAVIFQHEYDHLIGKLFTDRLIEQEELNYKKADVLNDVYYQLP